MNNVIQLLFPEHPVSSVIALHCSLGSGRQWTKLAAELGGRHQFIAPDISGYGDHAGALELPTTLKGEVEMLGGRLDAARGPIHLVGHSYGGAIAFKIATNSPYAHRIRSLTLIEPVLPTLLRASEADRRLHDRFKGIMHAVCEDMFNGLDMEAIDKFTAFWNGSGPPEQLSDRAWLRLIESAGKLPLEFTSLFAEANVSAAAAALRVPTLLVSGGLSPYLTQRIAAKLALIIPDAQARHLPAAGHMLPITHAAVINPEIARHIERADDMAEVSLAAG